MATMHGAATFSGVADDSRGERPVGQAFKDRRAALGISRSELAKRAGVDRSRIQMVEEDDPRLRESTIGQIDRALSALEQEIGMDLPSRVGESEKPRLIRIEVQGVYGAKALILEGEPEDREALEAMVDRIMRNLRNAEDDDPS